MAEQAKTGRGRPPQSRGRRPRKTAEEERVDTIDKRARGLETWVPKTELGKKVQRGEIETIAQLFEQNAKVMESEIVDTLIPEMFEEMVDFKKTSKVRRAGRMFRFRVTMLVGDGNGHLGLGTATDKERWPAVRKATKKAKLHMVSIRRGCGSWECTCGTGHSVPFKVEGKSSSIRVILLPAPRGTGLVVGRNIKNVMKFAGVQDVWSQTKGNTRSTLDFVSAAVDALAQTTKMRGGSGDKR